MSGPLWTRPWEGLRYQAPGHIVYVWGVPPLPRQSNNIRVGGGALGAHSSPHSLRPPPTFPMEDRQRVINHQLPPTQATMGKRGLHRTETGPETETSLETETTREKDKSNDA